MRRSLSLWLPMSLRLATLLTAAAMLLAGCAQSHLDEMASDLSTISTLAPSAASAQKEGPQELVDVIYDKPESAPAADKPVKAAAWGETDVRPAAETPSGWGDVTVKTAPLPKLADSDSPPEKKADAPVKVADGWLPSTQRVVSPEPMGPPPAAAPRGAPRGAPVVWGPGVVVQAGLTGGPTGNEPYFLDTGDRLRVFIYGQPNLSRLYTVDQVGNIAVPLIGSVRARGRTTVELERVIAARLGREFVRDPQVTVDVAQNRPFFILGEVRLPGQYPFVSGMTIEQAVAIGGGYTERASKRTYRITRKLGALIDQIEAPGDYPLCPGDTVYVYERWF